MEYTFHKTQLIRYSRSRACESAVIFWTELGWIYPTKATLLLSWSHGYENSTVVITIWSTVTKYPYLKWQWIFYFLCWFVLLMLLMYLYGRDT